MRGTLLGRTMSLLALVLLAAATARAQSNPASPEDAGFRLNLGGFFEQFDTKLTLGSASGGSGQEIDIEDAFGVGNRTSFRADGYWRLGPDFRVAFGYRGWARNSNHTLDRDIMFGNDVYHVGANVDFSHRANIVDFYLGYSFFHTPEFELGAMLGISASYTKFTLSATGNVTGPGGVPVAGAATTQSRNLLAPLPAFGGYVSYRVMPNFDVHADVRGFPTITLSHYKGNMVDFRGGLDYFFTQNVGLGVNYNYVKFNFSHTVPRIIALSYRYSGPNVYLALAF